MLHKIDFADILAEAHEAAETAIAKLGPENPYALDCGFAWVTIDGNHPLARWARQQLKASDNSTYQTRFYYGDKGYPKGWQWWKPGNFNGQAIGHHRAGANAFSEVLARYNIVGTVGSRYD